MDVSSLKELKSVHNSSPKLHFVSIDTFSIQAAFTGMPVDVTVNGKNRRNLWTTVNTVY